MRLHQSFPLERHPPPKYRNDPVGPQRGSRVEAGHRPALSATYSLLLRNVKLPLLSGTQNDSSKLHTASYDSACP